MECVRLFFEKKGAVKFVSHLDIMRCMQRAVRRAEIPLWYTEGFNPHPYLNFLSPLSLGIEGEREILDIRIDGDISYGEIKSRLNNVLPDGIKINAVCAPFHKSNDICYAEYVITFENEPGLCDKIKNAMASRELVTEKPGKVNGRKTMKTVNISDGTVKYDISENENGIAMNVVFYCGNENNLNPVNLISALKKYFNRDVYPVNIVRKSVLLSDFSYFD